MISRSDFEKLDEHIQRLKQAAQAVDALGDQFPAVKRNTARVLAGIKMMEINVSDIVQLTVQEKADTTPPV